jgi:molecular chaperone HtpG
MTSHSIAEIALLTLRLRMTDSKKCIIVLHNPAKKKSRGTDVILHINNESEEFLDEQRLKDILEKYCKFLPVEIKFGAKEERVEDGVDKDGKPQYKTVKVDRIINNPNPLWTKTPRDLKDGDYLNFYKELYPYSEDPLFWVHINVDYPFNLTGILYFPKVKNDFEANKNKIQLYSRQVFITNEVKDVVPDFLMLLHGVLDSPDIPLNVSRSYLQSDASVKKISQHITKKVVDKLQDLFKKDRPDFEKKWDDINIFVKYGIVTDEKFYDRAKEFTLLKNVEDQYFTLDEYKAKVIANQTGKNQQLVYLYASDKNQQHSFIETAKNKGYDVLSFGGIMDNHFINTLEKNLEKTEIKRVDSDIIERLITKEEILASVLSKEDEKQIKMIFEKAINKKNMTVAIEAMSPEELPVVITMNEFMRRMKDMAHTRGGYGFIGMPDNYNVTINGNHTFVQKILKEESEEQKTKLAKQIYDLALLSQNLLVGPDLTNFIKRSVELV